jgi:hypothetical protein
MPVSRDPRKKAPMWSYLTDGKSLVQVIQVDTSGAVAEDVMTGGMVTLTPIDLMQVWRRITPAQEAM